VKTLPEIFTTSDMNELDHCYLEALSEALKGNLREALELRNEADALASEGFSFSENYGNKYPFIEEAVNTLINSYEFTRCVKPSGEAYGTAGQCRKGTEEAKPVKATSPARRTKVERDMAAQATLKRLAAKGPDTSVRKQGDRIVVSRGSEFKAVLHPEHQTALGKLKEGERFKFEDESGTHWSATRSGNSIRLEGGDTRHGSKPYKMSMGRDKLM
jgi:hypothetical protein